MDGLADGVTPGGDAGWPFADGSGNDIHSSAQNVAYGELADMGQNSTSVLVRMYYNVNLSRLRNNHRSIHLSAHDPTG